MTISKINDLKKILVNGVSNYFKSDTNLSNVTMYYITPRKGYDYGIKLMYAGRRTILKFYLKKGRSLNLDKPVRMITRPRVVGIGDECLIFIGTIDLDMPNIKTLLPNS